MDENEILKERFKSAISSAVKVISEKFDIEIFIRYFNNYQQLAPKIMLKISKK